MVGFIFNEGSIETIAVNIASQAAPVLKSKIYGDLEKTGIAPTDPICKTGNSYSNEFYGTSTQYIYSPVSSAKTTKNGTISIQKN